MLTTQQSLSIRFSTSARCRQPCAAEPRNSRLFSADSMREGGHCTDNRVRKQTKPTYSQTKGYSRLSTDINKTRISHKLIDWCLTALSAKISTKTDAPQTRDPGQEPGRHDGEGWKPINRKQHQRVEGHIKFSSSSFLFLQIWSQQSKHFEVMTSGTENGARRLDQALAPTCLAQHSTPRVSISKLKEQN